jgi:hypothetical protein
MEDKGGGLHQNAATVFMCLMNGVFREYLDTFVNIFLDHIFIYSKTKEEHEQHLRMVFLVLREHKLYANLSKYIFYQKKFHYLGYIISRDGIIVDPEKIETIRGWSTPRNVIDVRSFMGLSIYYRRFIKKNSKI